jgi:hypothetical protein
LSSVSSDNKKDWREYIVFSFLENRSDIPYSSSPSVPIYFHSGYIVSDS